MKQLHNLFLGLIIFVSAQSALGQVTNGSNCKVGRTLIVLENKYFVEYIASLDWEKDKSYSSSIGGTVFQSVSNDTIDETSHLIVMVFPNILLSENFDSTIRSKNLKYETYRKEEIQKLSLHSSVPNRKRFVFRGTYTGAIVSVTYIKIGNSLVSFSLESPSNESYNNIIDNYIEFLSSIRSSKI